MQFRGMSRSHLFLIELIIVVLFFSFAGAVTVQVFSKAQGLAQSTDALSGAVMAVQTKAETDKTLEFKDLSEAEVTDYFNGSWNITDPSGAVYTLTTEVTLEDRDAGTMAIYSYSMKSDDELIWTLQMKKYYSGEFIDETSQGEVN